LDMIYLAIVLGIAIGIVVRVNRVYLDRISKTIERFFSCAIYMLVFLIGISSGYVIRGEVMYNENIVVYIVRDIAMLLGLTLCFTILIGVIVLRRVMK